ncbi:MAG TPA: fibronectin type III-like domain-contianing protein, partial [Chitinophagaceae bacterium]|nr:fibronectin type III-like domain-contianing protein [Chitinophagaceae bacterium]
PFTFPASIDQSPAHAMKAYPGENLSVTYKEGILVGYRWFDTKKIEPLYCFGYGLSYTDFSYSRLQTSKTNYKSGETITVTLTITNSGKYDGKETVQLYINKSGSAVERADKELKAFKKIMVNKGAAVEVKLKIPVADLAYYDTSKSKWIIEPGKYTLLAGTSSGIIKLNTTITIE